MPNVVVSVVMNSFLRKNDYAKGLVEAGSADRTGDVTSVAVELQEKGSRQVASHMHHAVLYFEAPTATVDLVDQQAKAFANSVHRSHSSYRSAHGLHDARVFMIRPIDGLY
jgi:hypothetical protein